MPASAGEVIAEGAAEAVEEAAAAALAGEVVGGIDIAAFGASAIAGAFIGLVRRGGKSPLRLSQGKVPDLQIGSSSVPWSAFSMCGNDLFNEGYKVSTSFVKSIGTMEGVPKGCMELMVTLSPVIQDTKGVVEPIPCGSQCLQCSGVDPVAWDSFVNMTETRLGKWQGQ